MVLLVLIQKIRPGKWEELAELDEKWDAADRRAGIPPERRFRCIFGGHDSRTRIALTEWDSLAAIEAAYENTAEDPEYEELYAQSQALVESTQRELYMPAA